MNKCFQTGQVSLAVHTKLKPQNRLNVSMEKIKLNNITLNKRYTQANNGKINNNNKKFYNNKT